MAKFRIREFKMKIDKEDGTKSDEEKKVDETIFQEYG